MRKTGRMTLILMIPIIVLCNLFTNVSISAAAQDQSSMDDLYIEIGDALMNAKDKKWDLVSENISSFRDSWKEINQADNNNAKDVTKQLQTVTKALSNPDKKPSQIRGTLSALSNALATYDKEINPVDHGQDKEKVKQLLPLIDDVEAAVKSNNWEQAKEAYQQLLAKWNENEVSVRNQSVSAYGQIETQLAFIRIGLSQEPPDKQKTLTGIHDLQTAISDFLSGNTAKQSSDESYTLDDVVQLLDQSAQAMADKDTNKATEHLNQILLIWPVVEGKVRTSDPKLYNEMERDVPKAISLLQSKNSNLSKASAIVTNLSDRLKVIADKTAYTFVDAMLILLREGLEAILIIAGLLAFLKRTNNNQKQVWVWTGAAAGIVTSALLAVGINLFLSNIAAGTSREYLEGIIGLIAVVMMLTVGSWMHKKSNINHWNHYIKRNLGKALAKGSLVSMAVLSFLSIFREGAETIIFYAGMAPSMEVGQLVLGIGIAFVLLIILGFIIIRYSAKVPLRPFFIGATILIYVLAFKMIGASVHALQVANTLPVHYVQHLPLVAFIGFYPTVETIVLQAVLLFIILVTNYYIKRSANLKVAPSH
jgi:high-affinity iron transporter